MTVGETMNAKSGRVSRNREAADGDRPPLVLASASPRRVELLRQLGWPFQVHPSHAPEVSHAHLTPREICQMNAHRKARTVAARFPEAVVLGADTIVCQEQVIFGKPADGEEARRMLGQLQGRTHQVITGICLMRQRTARTSLFAVATDVTFRPLSGAQIDQYLSLINPLDKAGAYAIQESGDQIVAGIVGSFSNVVGLPLERLNEELQKGKWRRWKR
jgi:septum formation protein